MLKDIFMCYICLGKKCRRTFGLGRRDVGFLFFNTLLSKSCRDFAVLRQRHMFKGTPFFYHTSHEVLLNVVRGGLSAWFLAREFINLSNKKEIGKGTTG